MALPNDSPLEPADPPRSTEAKIDEAYYQATLGKPLHDIYRQLDPFVKPPGLVLDLGCGVGTATLHYLQQGFRVLSVDRDPRALEILASRAPAGADLELVCSDMLAFELPTVDVLLAGFSLFFLSPEDFETFWPRLVAAIRPGGHFAGQFLGIHDEWAGRGHALVDADSLRLHLEPFEILHFEEVDREGQTALGNAKHWHVFHVVARKR